MFEEDIPLWRPSFNFGRQDTPGVEQIMRATIYKETFYEKIICFFNDFNGNY